MSLDLHWPALTEALVVWYAACYGRTRATGDMAPYPGDAALALMQTIFICLWRLADVHRELAQATDMLTHFHALHRDRATAAKAKESLKPAQSLMDTIKNAISKPRCSSVLVAQLAHVAHVAHVVRAIMMLVWTGMHCPRAMQSKLMSKRTILKPKHLSTSQCFIILYSC